MKFDATYVGRVYSLVGGTLYRFSDGYFRGVSASANVDGDVYQNAQRVALTGYSVESAKGNVGYQTTGGSYIILSEGWQQTGIVSISRYSDTQANKLIKKIIDNNKIILRNNLLCARFVGKLTYDQQSQVRELQSRLQARNDALQAEGLTQDVRTSYPSGYAELAGYLDALMKSDIIGIASWVVIVIAAVVIAGMGTAAYFAYKSLAEESEKDVKFSEDLTRTLVSKLTDEEYQQLLNETKGIVTKAKIKQAFGSYWNVIKVAAFAVAGYSAYKLIKGYIQNR